MPATARVGPGQSLVPGTQDFSWGWKWPSCFSRHLLPSHGVHWQGIGWITYIETSKLEIWVLKVSVGCSSPHWSAWFTFWSLYFWSGFQLMLLSDRRRCFNYVSPYFLCRSEWSLWLLALPWTSHGYCGHLGNKTLDRRYLLLPSLSAFYILLLF